MIPKLEIKLSDDKSVYFPGDKLEGRVLVDVPTDTSVRGYLQEPVSETGSSIMTNSAVDLSALITRPGFRVDTVAITGLKLQCVGIGMVTWAAGFGDQATTHFEKEKYVNITETLLEEDLEDNASEESVLSPGNHCFEFQICLPSNIPQSLEEPGCFIRYRLKACLRRTGNSDVVTKLTFQVGGTAKLDLNTIPEARSPSVVNSSKRESRWCRRDGFVSASLRLERTGYIPGESIVCTAEVEDNSNTKKVITKFKLYKKITKRVSTGQMDAMQTKLLEVSRTPERSGKADLWSQETIIVPSVPPSTLLGCKVIELGYFVCLVVKPFDIRIPVDIVIGTEPFHPVEPTNEIVTEVDVHATISDLGHEEIKENSAPINMD